MVQDSSPSKDTRTQLLNAAIDMFHEKGFQKTRVSDIVAAAQVAQGTFYLYFKSKDEIFLQIAADFKNRFAELIENSDQLLSGNSYPEVRENLLIFIRQMVQLYSENTKMARILFYENGQTDCQFRHIWQELYSSFIAMVKLHLENHRNSPFIVFEDAETEAAFLVGLLSRSLLYFIELKHDLDFDTLSRRMTDFILGGISKQGMNLTSDPAFENGEQPC